MNEDISNRERELLERERELQQRALELRLRELDADVNRREAPFHPTIRHQDREKPVRTFKQDLVRAAKFSGLFLGGVVVVYLSQWLAWISVFALLATAGWLWVKLRDNK